MHIEVTLAGTSIKHLIPVENLVVVRQDSTDKAAFYHIGDSEVMEITPIVETYDVMITRLRIEERKQMVTQLMAGFAAHCGPEVDEDDVDEIIETALDWANRLSFKTIMRFSDIDLDDDDEE